MDTPRRKSIPVRRLTFSENPSNTTIRNRKETQSARKTMSAHNGRRKRSRLSPYLKTSAAHATHKAHMTQYTVGKSVSFSGDLVMELQALVDTHKYLEPVIEETAEENWDNDCQPPIPSVLVEAFENVKL